MSKATMIHYDGERAVILCPACAKVRVRSLKNLRQREGWQNHTYVYAGQAECDDCASERKESE